MRYSLRSFLLIPVVTSAVLACVIGRVETQRRIVAKFADQGISAIYDDEVMSIGIYEPLNRSYTHHWRHSVTGVVMRTSNYNQSTICDLRQLPYLARVHFVGADSSHTALEAAVDFPSFEIVDVKALFPKSWHDVDFLN